MDDIRNISPGNKALIFIDERIQHDNYRGVVSSQHNRYDLEELDQTLKLLDHFAPNGTLLQIRTTDLSKRPYNIEGEEQYAAFCREVNKMVGKGTQDSIRKNLLVDWHRMGFVTRYDENRKEVTPYQGGTKKFVALTELGKDFINASGLEKSYLFSKAINTLHEGFVVNTLQVLDELQSEPKSKRKLSLHEFMFFVTAIDVPDYGITVSECYELIKEYRTLSKHQVKLLIHTLSEQLKPENYEGDKVDKRDFHNWVNKNQQMWHLFKEIVFFIVDDQNDTMELLTSDTATSLQSRYERSKMKRSVVTKRNYFEHHKVEKEKGYELDHIIPLMSARSIEEFKYLDHWKNLLYISAHEHAVKSQTSSHYQILEKGETESELLIRHIYKDDDALYLRNDKNALFNPDLTDDMVQYNHDYLQTPLGTVPTIT